MPSSTAPDLFAEIGLASERESPLWRESLRAPGEQEREPVFSKLAEERFALGLETIYEGYLAHYGVPRLFALADADTALLLGDYLYAHGLVRIAEAGGVAAVTDLAELISLCAQLRAEPGGEDDGPAWAATAALMGTGRLDLARDALRLHRDPGPLLRLAQDEAGEEPVDRALADHRARVG